MKSGAGVFERVLAVALVGGVLAGVGCLGADAAEGVDPGVKENLQSGGHHAHHRHPMTTADASAPDAGGGTGLGAAGAAGAAGGAPAASDAVSIAAACKVCSIAIACCEAVGGGPECTFSATTCATLGDAARGPYVDACETFVKTVFTTWRYNPPAECH